LKRSRSRNSTATSRSRERAAETIEEQRAIRQSGQRVVEGVVQQLLLETAAFGDVFADRCGADHAPFDVVQQRVIPRHGAALAETRHDFAFIVRRDRTDRERVLVGLAQRLLMLVGHEAVEPVDADHVFFGAAQELDHELVGERDIAVHVAHHRDEADVFENVAHPPFGLAERVFGELAIVDVDAHPERAEVLAVTRGGDDDVDPAILLAAREHLQLVAGRAEAVAVTRAFALGEQRLKIGVDERRDLASDQLADGEAAEIGTGGIGVGDDAVPGHQDRGW
jgi:hypothetical protein